MFFPFPIQLGLCGLLRLRWLSAICRHIDTLVGGRRLACWYGIPRSDARRLSWGVPRPNPLFNGILVETGLFRWGFHQWQVATILLIAQGWLQKRKDPQLNVLWVFIFLFPKKSCSTIDWYATKPVFFALYKKHLGVDRVSLFGEQFNPIYWIPKPIYSRIVTRTCGVFFGTPDKWGYVLASRGSLPQTRDWIRPTSIQNFHPRSRQHSSRVQCGFFAKIAIQISENHPEESCSNKILFMCIYVETVVFELEGYNRISICFSCCLPLGLHAEIDCPMPLPPLCGFLYPGSCWPIAWSVWSEWPFECILWFFGYCFHLWSWWTHKRQSTNTLGLLNGGQKTVEQLPCLYWQWLGFLPRQWRSIWRPTYLHGNTWQQDASWESFTFTRCVPSIITSTIFKGMWLVHPWTPGKLWHVSVTSHFWGASNGLGSVVTRPTWWKDCSKGTSYS